MPRMAGSARLIRRSSQCSSGPFAIGGRRCSTSMMNGGSRSRPSLGATNEGVPVLSDWYAEGGSQRHVHSALSCATLSDHQTLAPPTSTQTTTPINRAILPDNHHSAPVTYQMAPHSGRRKPALNKRFRMRFVFGLSGAHWAFPGPKPRRGARLLSHTRAMSWRHGRLASIETPHPPVDHLCGLRGRPQLPIASKNGPGDHRGAWLPPRISALQAVRSAPSAPVGGCGCPGQGAGTSCHPPLPLAGHPE